MKDLYRRGLRGENLQLIVTDGCAGLAAAIQAVYPRARHQRCWVHKMRNILERYGVAIMTRSRTTPRHLSGGGALPAAAARALSLSLAGVSPWYGAWSGFAELLTFFRFPRHLWRKLRTTNTIERCFVEVRRRTRPMVVFINVESVDRIIYAIFQRFNLEWKTHTLNLFTQAA